MNQQETLVIIIPGFPINEDDTTCLPTQQNLIKALNRNYPVLKIFIIAFQYPFVEKTYEWHSNTVISFYAKKGIFRKIFVWIRLWNLLKSINRKYKVTGILSLWCAEYAIVAKMFARKYKLKQYCWLMGQDARPGNKFIGLLQPRPGSVIALSHSLADEFYRNYKVRPAHVIPNGINISQFENDSFDRDVDVLAVGSLIQLKQYDVFVKVIKELKNYLPDIRCVICGKGPEEEALKRLILESGLQKNISMLGELPHVKVLQIMQRSKVLLHPSSYEGFPAVCIEALYAGASVVSFVQPMNEEIERWHVVSNTNEMIAAVLSLLQDCKATYPSVLVYDVNDMVKALMDLYRYQEHGVCVKDHQFG